MTNHRLQAYEACQLPLLHPTCISRGGRTRTYEVVRREIYSLLRLPLRDTPLLCLAGAEGLEPPTFGFGDRRSTG